MSDALGDPVQPDPADPMDPKDRLLRIERYGINYLGVASGTAQAVINTYGTGLDTASIIPLFPEPRELYRDDGLRLSGGST